MEKAFIVKDGLSELFLRALLELDQKDPKEDLLGLIARLAIFECLYDISNSYFVNEDLSQCGIELNDMMKTATDAASKSFIFGGVEAIYQSH